MLKTLLGAVALTFAVPALAQPAPAANPHAGHAQHGQATPAQHGQAAHGQHGPSGEQQQHSGHGGHADHAQHMRDCCKDGQDDEKMHCCDKHADAAPEGAADHSQHGN